MPQPAGTVSISPTDQRPIGIFDSGVGGLTVVGQIHKTLPNEDLVYLGDTARVPYGSKSPATVVRFACEDTAFLVGQHVKAVVVACNTASAWALPTLAEKFSVPIFGVIEPGAAAAVVHSARRRIGVIGTKATIRSGAYARSILGRDPSAKIFAAACPLLVPLVEEGWVEHAVTLAVLEEYLAPLLKQEVDTLVLGCTHYPLLKAAIQKVAGPEVRLVDSAESCATYVLDELARRQLLNSDRARSGIIQPFVTDEVERFEDLAERFLGVAMQDPAKVDLPLCLGT
jgi:glutamate racemase